MEWDFGRTGGIRRRGYLPHIDVDGSTQFITFKLFDSLPEDVLTNWHTELEGLSAERKRLELGRRVERFLDEGHGSCLLKDNGAAAAVEKVMLHSHGERFVLHAWVIMSNHVHTLATLINRYSISAVVGDWKHFSALAVNRSLGRKGRVWEHGYYDRRIRDEAHFKRVVSYIHNNPVKAGRVKAAEDFQWSSAARQGSFKDCLRGGTGIM